MFVIFFQNIPGFPSFEQFASRMKPAGGGHLREHCPISEEARAEYEARLANRNNSP